MVEAPGCTWAPWPDARAGADSGYACAWSGAWVRTHACVLVLYPSSFVDFAVAAAANDHNIFSLKQHRNNKLQF